MIPSDISIIFRGKTTPRIALAELADELLNEIEGIGDVTQSRNEEFGWSIFARVESTSAVNAVVIAMGRLLSQQGIRADSVSVEVAGQRSSLSKLVP